MSHQLFLGTKAFDVNGCSMGYHTTDVRSESGRPLRWLIQFAVECKMLGSGSADLTKKEEQAKTALQQPFVDIKLVDSVSGPVGISIFDAKTLSGVMLTEGPTFADSGEPGEYVTFRTLRFAGEAQMVIPGQALQLVSYQESISVTGNGGPVRKWRIPINAQPIRQTIAPGSIIQTVQAGKAVQHTGGFPKAPPPLYGRQYLVNEMEAVRQIQPTPVGKGWVNYGVEWSYMYETIAVPRGMPALPRM